LKGLLPNGLPEPGASQDPGNSSSPQPTATPTASPTAANFGGQSATFSFSNDETAVIGSKAVTSYNFFEGASETTGGGLRSAVEFSVKKTGTSPVVSIGFYSQSVVDPTLATVGKVYALSSSIAASSANFTYQEMIGTSPRTWISSGGTVTVTAQDGEHTTFAIDAQMQPYAIYGGTGTFTLTGTVTVKLSKK
jgi:hypothetical protein